VNVFSAAKQSNEPAVPEARQPARSRFWRQLIIMIVLNAMITLLLVMIGQTNDFLETYRICNAIGFAIWGIVELLRWAAGERLSSPTRAVLAVPTGFIIGSKLAALTGAKDLIELVVHDPAHQWRLLLGSVMVAAVATSFFLFYWRAEGFRADLQSERRRAAEALQSETQAKLALLQAQIEPHFLFNTLANAQSVIESDPGTAKTILTHLDQYLRVSLGRTRRSGSTLADELALLGALLEIARLRLAERLRYSIHVPQELRSALLPPLLLQPLVENALKHGIEPAVMGGEIRIEARREGELMRLSVTDTGVGLNASSPEGIGLANVRARLTSLYGDQGQLALYRHEPHGVVAAISLPIQTLEAARR